VIEFLKAHGIGNDFVVIPDLDGEIEISPDAVRRLCDRRFGIGADAVIRIARRNGKFFMDYRNNDGSVAEMCGNGTRVVGKWLGDRGYAEDSVDLDTRDGIKALRLHRGADGLVETVVANMGPPTFPELVTEKIVIGTQSFEISRVSMGNPHAVMFVDDVDKVPLDVVGPLIQSDSATFPEGVNVEVADVQPDGLINERTYERGVGETLACGTAASAVAVAGQRRGLSGERVQMQLRGGRLLLEWKPGESVFMTGPAVESFRGTFEPSDFGVTAKS
jgi:diaminopimelate epimerase